MSRYKESDTRNRQERDRLRRREGSRERVERKREEKQMAEKFLREYKDCQQNPGDPHKRWYNDVRSGKEISVVLWRDGYEGFQITHSGKVITWTPQHGMLIADSKESRGFYTHNELKSSEIENEHLDEICQYIGEHSNNLPSGVSRRVTEELKRHKKSDHKVEKKTSLKSEIKGANSLKDVLNWLNG